MKANTILIVSIITLIFVSYLTYTTLATPVPTNVGIPLILNNIPDKPIEVDQHGNITSTNSALATGSAQKIPNTK